LYVGDGTNGMTVSATGGVSFAGTASLTTAGATSSVPWVVGSGTATNTAEGTAYWESDTDLLTIGDGAARKTLLNTDSAIDGEYITADTIDDDSIDFSDVTCADLTTTDCGAITSSGNIQGLITPVEDADGIAVLGAADMAGQAYYNTTKANDYVLPAAAPGLNACFYATSAHAVTIRPLAAGNDHIWYGASDCGEDDDLVGPATIGSFVCLHARDAVNWMTWGSANTWTCE
jgi:hypothetical protein